ncbi:MAG: glycerol kinase GlpK [Alphaproteobacteria bacterium]|nr:glycerol kinase GlpK [Alphaproteobacteria bacterium]
MATGPHILAIDQGTTSTRAILFDRAGAPVATAQRELRQIYPQSGWVEHDPEEIWQATLETCRQVLATDGYEVAGIGITNQRETTILWDRETGAPIHNAIVWQDRRTAEACRAVAEAGHAPLIAERTGLVPNPYFSASKLAWLLDNIDVARAQAGSGKLAFGTIDSFLLWRLTGGAVHATDATNASRTGLFDIHRQVWDDDLLELWRLPAALLPEVRDSTGDFGETAPDLFNHAIPIRGIAGDQQAASIGQACFTPGMVKSTYGTGAFMLLNTGDQPVTSDNRLLTTIAYRLDGQTSYALEGSIFVAGAAVQWLRDGLKIIDAAPDTEAMAEGLASNRGVYMVPAFTGLGAPHWDPEARGALFGLTRDTGTAEIARAALEAVAYQSHDLLDAMARDHGQPIQAIRIDGGMAANDWLGQFLADILNLRADRPAVIETTALGAAYLAGLGAGVYANLDEIADLWRHERSFAPAMDDNSRAALLSGWRDAISRLTGLAP